MAVAFEELAGSPTLEVVDGRITARREFRVAWSDYADFIAELWGQYRSVGGGFVYQPPAYFPQAPQAIVNEVSVEPFDADNPNGAGVGLLSSATNSYDAGARVTAVYRSDDVDDGLSRGDLPGVPTGTYLRYRANLASDYVAMPGRVFRWQVDGEPVADDVNPGILVPSEAFTLSWLRVPLPPWNTIRDSAGKLNNATFLNYPAGTVLFTGAETRHDFQIVDTGLWRLDYHFKVRLVHGTGAGSPNLGWNHFYREQASSGEHWLEVVDEDGNNVYQSGNFSALFTLGT
ncbi:MAG: hypothetical protein R3C10_03635 [Pirellulales bacterium]